jgi:hypothetical protein
MGEGMKYEIDEKQIDAAWRSISLATSELQAVMYHLLGHFFGIKRCEGCGGSGYDDPDFHDDLGKCPDCNGHGWVIGGEDE